MHKQFLQQAIDLASKNVGHHYGGPYGAIIVKEEKIIASSGNRVTTNIDPTAHAEIMVIRQACQFLGDYKLSNCILYSSCEPCPMCLGAIYWARIEKIFFACTREDAARAGFDDSFIYDEILLPSEKRSIPMLQIDMSNAQQPFDYWKNDQNKRLY